jgi:tetratricopeptide (TPR) repeat protein
MKKIQALPDRKKSRPSLHLPLILVASLDPIPTAELCTLNAHSEEMPRMNATPNRRLNMLKNKLAAGVRLYQQQQWQAASRTFEAVLKSEPKQFDAQHLLGLIAHRQQDYDRAVKCFTQAIALQPLNATPYYNLGLTLQERKEYATALRLYQMALELQPANVKILNNQGIVLKELKRYEQALSSYAQAITLDPRYARSYVNRAGTWLRLGNVDAALADCDRAIQLQADHVEAWFNRAFVLAEGGRHADAITGYQYVLTLDPHHAMAQFALSLCYLITGNLLHGWQQYEWRWQDQSLGIKKPTLPQPEWDGHCSLLGKKILVYFEQGLGDTLQFCRFVQPLKQQGAEVILLVQPVLQDLVQSLDPGMQVVSGGQLPEVDYLAPLLSLPLLLGIGLAELPTASGYLHASAERLQHWQQRLGPQLKLRIGLAWRGNSVHKNDHNRSLSLAALLQALPEQFDYVCLQKDLDADERQRLQSRPDIRVFSDELTTFSDTAALCQQLDLVISVDTSVAHLAGALGKPLWVLLPFNPDWRWLLERTDSPWYPDATLLRQPEYGDWSSLLDTLPQRLSAWLQDPHRATQPHASIEQLAEA